MSFPNNINFEVRGKFEYETEEVKILAQAYLPGVVVLDSKIEPATIVEYVESQERRIEKNDFGFRIYDNWNGKLSLDIWHFIYSLLRVYFLEQKLFSVHASCAGKGKYVLLAGHTGSGKSTILLKLLNDYGWTSFSGNKTIVSLGNGKIEAIFGTKSMSLGETDPARFPNLISRKVNYQRRNAFIVDDKHYSHNSIEHISTIYLVKLNDGVSEIEELFYPSNLHSLYPYFLDVVNADTIMCDGEDVFVGTPPIGVQTFLSKKLKESLSKIKVIRISGSLEFVTKYIAES